MAALEHGAARRLTGRQASVCVRPGHSGTRLHWAFASVSSCLFLLLAVLQNPVFWKLLAE